MNASFVIKHILEDDVDSITPYFTQNGMESLLARVKGVRAKGRIVIIKRTLFGEYSAQRRYGGVPYVSFRKTRSAVKEL